MSQIQEYTQQSSPLEIWNPDQLSLIKSQIAVGCTDSELILFAQVCQKTGLDPFTKQIYAIARNTYNKETNKKEPKMTIQVSIDGFRLMADRSGNYAGSECFWCGSDGVWSDVWLSGSPPSAAKAVVWKKGSDRPFVATARFDAYAQSYNGKLSGLWQTMPDVMIAKCAESLALRKAFPAELSGLYTREEMDQTMNEVQEALSQPSANKSALLKTLIQLGSDIGKGKDQILTDLGNVKKTSDASVELINQVIADYQQIKNHELQTQTIEVEAV